MTSAQTRAPADAGQIGRAQERRREARWAGAEDAETQREHAGHEQGREQAQGRGFTVRRCARGAGGAYDIGRDGTSSGGARRLTAADALRRADELMGVSYR